MVEILDGEVNDKDGVIGRASKRPTEMGLFSFALEKGRSMEFRSKIQNSKYCTKRTISINTVGHCRCHSPFCMAGN